jgi:hypothetical protein
LTGAAACTSCEEGKYSTAVAATGTSTCQQCSANSYSPSSGSSSSTSCICSAGYSGPAGGTCTA